MSHNMMAPNRHLFTAVRIPIALRDITMLSSTIEQFALWHPVLDLAGESRREWVWLAAVGIEHK